MARPSNDHIDFDLIENQKENIQALPSGRSAKALAAVFSPRPLNQSTQSSELDETRTLNDAVRREYEAELDSIAESDDPLDIYDRYVKWTLDAYPSAQATSQSGLLPLLERATNAFLSSTHYKNDPRYLRLWLHYIQLFSDSPRETFAFLARHGVGAQLALFYEEFASWLERDGRIAQAEEVYKMGIEKEARPIERLFRKFGEFQKRAEQRPSDSDGPSSPALPKLRPALAAKFDPFASSAASQDPQAATPSSGLGGGATANRTRSGKPKMAIFSDADGGAEAAKASSSPGTGGWDSIGSLKDRRKENTIEPTPWAGQTLKAGKKPTAVQKMTVFKDESSNIRHSSKSMQTTNVSRNNNERVDPRTGKIERVVVNLEAIYPDPHNPAVEMSLDELRAISRGWMSKDWSKQRKKPLREIPQNEITSKELQMNENGHSSDKHLSMAMQEKLQIHDEAGRDHKLVKGKKLKVKEIKGETQIVKTNLDSPTGPRIKKRGSTEPTMTFHTKAATDEIYGIFNQPLKSELQLAKDVDSVYGSDYEDDDYTSVGEITTTSGISAPGSEFGDDETNTFEATRASIGADRLRDQTEGDITSVSAWTEFSPEEHIPRAGTRTPRDGEDAENSDSLGTMPTPRRGDRIVHQDENFVLVPPEDYNPPRGPYRDAFVAAQNRLPFMTPIVEHTETSLASTMFKNKHYMSSKTPSKGSKPLFSAATPAIPEIDDLIFAGQDDTEFDVLGEESPSKMAGRARSPRNLLKRGGLIEPRVIIEDPQCNPIDATIRNKILNGLQPSLRAYPGYNDHTAHIGGNGPEIKKYLKALAKPSKANGGEKQFAIPPIICLSGAARSYAVKRELGEGGFAPVYLAESIDSPDTFSDSEQENLPNTKSSHWAGGNASVLRDLERKSLEALKVESDPASPWEYYMLSTARNRIENSSYYRRAKDSIVQCYEMHMFKDESILVEDYLNQGTLLDLINIKTESAGPVTPSDQGLEEVVIMFFAAELFRTVEALHSCGILHGDLKPDNCLVRLPEPASAATIPTPRSGSLLGGDEGFRPEDGSAEYSPSGLYGWKNRGLTLIDFGRAIDMCVFKPEVQFIADWKVGQHECVEMRECRPWTYQVDLYGLAGTIYVMLFGKYMEVSQVTERTSNGPGSPSLGNERGLGAHKTYRIKESLKRYWEREIWSEVFDLLLNPLSPRWVEIEQNAREKASPVSGDTDKQPAFPVGHLDNLEKLIARKRGKRDA
ncbi:BUB protein kinase [Nannizzia gypsea CBS 118893]|uniref:BUB protein kinase n=1 Tax=Arthroderma gypseum (strain ATCC MYA-4604 / CBS 118893) TaxID=535722 RepID=E4V6Z9_ARTGP|nr:BUB protein kinase [Nannizzia gypsea CBS 118893]EFQ96865.1 BUB protein kinase [Nannizzia gypsea CBS 118893]